MNLEDVWVSAFYGPASKLRVRCFTQFGIFEDSLSATKKVSFILRGSISFPKKSVVVVGVRRAVRRVDKQWSTCVGWKSRCVSVHVSLRLYQSFRSVLNGKVVPNSEFGILVEPMNTYLVAWCRTPITGCIPLSSLPKWVNCLPSYVYIFSIPRAPKFVDYLVQSATY